MLAPSIVSGAEWRIVPSIDLSETYTDNVMLGAGADAESDWITQVNPGLLLTGTGRNLELSLGYRMQNIFYADNGDRDNANQQFNTRLHATLAPRWLFVDASAALSQQVLDPGDNVSVGNLAIVSNREDVLTSSISPYIATSVARNVLAELRFTHDRVTYSGDAVADSTADQVNIHLQSAQTFYAWTWGLRYTEQEIQYSDQDLIQAREDERRQDTALDLGYQIGSRLRLTGQLGYENHEYLVNVASETPEGRYWSLGVVWTPSARTSLTASGGHRYFGRTWSMALTHRARRNNWQLGYNEDIATRRQLQLERHDELELNEDDEPVFDQDSSEQLSLVNYTLVPTDEVFISRAAEFQWTIDHRASSTTFRATRSRREFQESDSDESRMGIGLGWNWRVSRLADFHANYRGQRTKRDAGDDRYKTVSLSYETQHGRHVNSSFVLRNVQRDTDGAGNNYKENQISARLQIHW